MLKLSYSLKVKGGFLIDYRQKLNLKQLPTDSFGCVSRFIILNEVPSLPQAIDAKRRLVEVILLQFEQWKLNKPRCF